MKNLLIPFSAFVLLSANAQTTNPGAYCTAEFSDAIFPVDHHISQVNLGSLTNNSGNSQQPAPHYIFYSNINAPVLHLGQTYTLTIQHDDGQTIHGIGAWIDFNKNNSFENFEKIGETLWPGDDNPSNGASVSYTVTIPSTVTSGPTRMRIRIYEDDDYTFSGNNLPVLPCQTFAWGETEDYTVQLQANSTASLETEAILPFKQIQRSFQFEEPVWIDVYNLIGMKIMEEEGNSILFDQSMKGDFLLHIHTTNGKEKTIRIHLD